MAFSSISMLAEQTHISLQKERYSLAKIYKQKGIPSLLNEIDKRARHPSAFLYVLLGPLGQIVQANVEQIETDKLRMPGLTQANLYTYIHYGQTSEQYSRKAMVVELPLQNGFRLLIGRDLSDLDRYVKITSRALLAALLFMCIGALLIWFFVSRRVLQNIDNITKASKHIMNGDLSKRLPTTSSNDELGRLVVNLNAMLEKIENLNSGIQEISDNIAHDLKTPLTRVKNIAQAAMMDGASDNFSADTCQNSLANIIAQLDQIIATFNAILLVARLETGQATESIPLLNIEELIKDVLEFCAPVAQNAGVDLILGNSFDYYIHLNRELVAQALFNIFDNAIKYGICMTSAASIVINMKIQSMSDGTEKLLLIIDDNGPGVEESDIEKLSDRFYRAEKSRTCSGVGIGLNLVKAIMQFHNGEMELSNIYPGFRVTLSFLNDKNINKPADK